MRHLVSVIIFLLFFQSSVSFAQSDFAPSNKNAKENFSYGNFRDALIEFLQLLKDDSSNVSYLFHIGVCYNYTNIDKDKAVYYLEAATDNPKADNNAWYELGSAYMKKYMFDKAIAAFEKYREVTGGKESFEISSDRMIQMCEEAKYMMQHPVNVTILNAGAEINSAFADYNPYIPGDESFIVFSTKRSGVTGNQTDFDGYNAPDVFISYRKYEKWTKAKGIGNSINSDLVEETAGLSPDGNTLSVYANNYNAMGQTMLSVKKGKTFQKPVSLGPNITSIKFISSASVSPDKKTLVFACDKNASEAGTDLYVSRILPSGEWGPPENMGAEVNTVYREDYPYFAADGKTLYFCSQGHNSMGGYDIFKTVFDSESNSWSEPVNLGYPINTPDDDMTLSLSASGRHGFIASFRNDGLGDLDIYKVIFNDIDPAYLALSGTLVNSDSVSIFTVHENLYKRDSLIADSLSKAEKHAKTEKITHASKAGEIKTGVTFPLKKDLKAEITVTGKNNQKIYGRYRPNKETGKFVIILPPGEFDIDVKADGYANFSETVTVFEKSVNDYNQMDFVLSPELKE